VICDIRIGTSGWHYAHWRGPYYPEDLPASKMLAFYLGDFDTVEINNSFYHLPARSTFEAWRAATPPGFVFAVKGSRYLTHMKKLKDPDDAIGRFFESAVGLGKKLGPVLFQLPPHWRCNTERLELFLRALPRRHRYAFEFREPSWHCSDVFDVLRRHDAALCTYHLAGFEAPRDLTADFAYVRLHGPGAKYQGSYDRASLRAWARQIDRWSATLRAVYVYFDNDQAGYAAQNARTLRELVGITRESSPRAAAPMRRSG
jgi:uncharacterized protein YecE (DUF72 family)